MSACWSGAAAFKPQLTAYIAANLGLIEIRPDPTPSGFETGRMRRGLDRRTEARGCRGGYPSAESQPTARNRL
jgi:hypothetical protein